MIFKIDPLRIGRDQSLVMAIARFESSIVRWLGSASVGRTDEKRLAIARDMFWPAYDNGLTEGDIESLANAFASTPFQISEGDIFSNLRDYLKVKSLNPDLLVPFLRDLSDLTPVGLNTSPNACCGRWELLYRLLRPGSRQPTKGDILDDGRTIELKGREVRIQDTEITGEAYIKTNNAIFAGSGFLGNETKAEKWRGGLVFEVEKRQHRLHYEKQWSKSPGDARSLIARYIKEHGFDQGLGDQDVESFVTRVVGDAGEYNLAALQNLQLKCFFGRYKKKQEFDLLIVFGDGSNVKIIEEDEDLSRLEIKTDYFRIGQTTKIGWYVE